MFVLNAQIVSSSSSPIVKNRPLSIPDHYHRKAYCETYVYIIVCQSAKKSWEGKIDESWRAYFHVCIFHNMRITKHDPGLSLPNNIFFQVKGNALRMTTDGWKICIPSMILCCISSFSIVIKKRDLYGPGNYMWMVLFRWQTLNNTWITHILTPDKLTYISRKHL